MGADILSAKTDQLHVIQSTYIYTLDTVYASVHYSKMHMTDST